jgi:predicted nucleic acid-binding Zn ribbon protein
VKIHYHKYECEKCVLNFAVEMAFEDQNEIVCPVCRDDDQLNDAGEGAM